jgi:hypothetical protein
MTRDLSLIQTLRAFKVWWINYALRGSYVPSDGETRLINLTKAIGGLKVLAAWAGWYASGCLSDKPDLLPEFPGFNQELQVMELAWFGGPLSVLRCATSVDQSLADALCQVRVFGRALPPPFGSKLVEDGLATIGVLSRAPVEDPVVLNLFELASEKIGSGYPSAPWCTHISVSRSATLLSTPEMGGRALDVELALTIWLESVTDLPEGLWFDCWNNIIVQSIEGVFLPGSDNYLYDNRSDLPTGVVSMIYPWIGDPIDHIFELEDKPAWLGPKLGYLTLALASMDALEHGSYDPPHENTIHGVPVWSTDVPKRFIPDPERPYHCRFKVLGEPGFKTRPLTINDWSLSVIQQAMRFLIEPPFHADGRVRVGFESQNIMWDLGKFLSKALPTMSGEIVFNNSDFKASTDYISLGLIRAMWRGFLRGINLPKRHPFWVFSEIIWSPRFVETTLIPDGFVQRRGSFMGEPMSFLNLSLVNLCLTEIAGYASKQLLPLGTVINPLRFRSEPRDGTPCGIVGDDNLSVGSQLFVDWFHNMGERAGMVFSKGKDLTSKNLLILCEDHAWFDGAKVTHLSTIKARLLTRMTRMHSDNRSAILGKASMLMTQLSWDDKPMVVLTCRIAYLLSFMKELGGKTFIPNLPLELPPNLGGICLPAREPEALIQSQPLLMRFLVWMEIQPMEVFLYWYLRLSHVNRRVPKGSLGALDIDAMSKAFVGFIEGDAEDFLNGRPRRFFGRRVVVQLLHDAGIIIPTTQAGFPINRLVIEGARSLGLIPISEIVDMQDRIEAFSDLLTGGSMEPKKLSFARYQRDYHKVLKAIKTFSGSRSEIGQIPMETVLKKLKDPNQFGKTLAVRTMVYVPENEINLLLRGEAPTFRVAFPK